MNIPPIILASESPRRSQLLKQLEFDFQVVPPKGVREMHQEHLTPQEIAQLNAHMKARSISKKFPDALVLGADTIVVLGKEIFGKPSTRQEAREMLQRLQGKSHLVVTGVCLIHLRNHQERLFSDTTEVFFKKLSEEAIDQYLASVKTMDKAGGYAIQENGNAVVKKIRGSRSNVIGLPLERLKSELEQFDQALAH